MGLENCFQMGTLILVDGKILDLWYFLVRLEPLFLLKIKTT